LQSRDFDSPGFTKGVTTDEKLVIWFLRDIDGDGGLSPPGLDIELERASLSGFRCDTDLAALHFDKLARDKRGLGWILHIVHVLLDILEAMISINEL
jgi:hypothetical protein